MKLSPERRAELLNELRLRMLFRDKLLCRRYGVSRATLWRLQAEMLDEPMKQNASDTLHVVCFTGDRKKGAKAA